MERDHERSLSFTRRALFVGALQGGLMAVLAGRLGWLQIAESERYRTLAEDNRINIRLIPPARGLIVDRRGIQLAANGQNFRAVIVPEQTEKRMEAVLTKLNKLIGLTQRDIQRVMKQAEKNPPFAPLEVKENLDWESVARVEVNLPDLPGVSIDVGEVRYYPMADATAHIIGYVGAVSKNEDSNDPVLKLPGFKIGKTGIEKTYDLPLRGKAGTAEIEVNVKGREVRELRRYAGEPGQKVVLSLDSELQKYAQQRLSVHKSASAVIMDAKTGEVYALASHPSFDPNIFARGLSAEKWEELLADPGLPLNNKAASGQYPPGLTFKMITALAGLEAGLINYNTTTFCPGHYSLGDNKFHCWKAGGHGNVNLTKALAESCDTYFYKYAADLGINRLAAMARKLGIAERMDIELTEERIGLMPTSQWKRENMKEPWQPGESLVAAIGQGYILATPLQLAAMTARLVNGGYAVKPWLTGYVGSRPGHDFVWPKIGLNQKHLGYILKGMDHVVNVKGGTAYGSRITEKGMEMAGKTGTSQVRRITKEQRAQGPIKQEDLPWKFRHHALFVGYAPVADPRYVCAVVVEHGMSGSGAAAPVAKDLLLETQKRNPAAIALRPDQPKSEPQENRS